jgi:hypothetical protein
MTALRFPQSLFSLTERADQSVERQMANTVKKLGWLERCLQHHSCGNGEGNPLPTRIVDVGRSNDDIRLVISGNLQARYVCLSHCWGDHQPLRLTKSTYNQFQKAIPWDELPKTFQEAIAFTRELGIRYLWIDSLAILQDDKSDWLVESARMYAVFHNSYLTLAATAGRNGMSGLYTERVKRHSFEFSGSRSRFTVSTRAIIEHAKKWSLYSYYYPLLTRAWVLQERFLSPRVLHFGPHELFWECQDDVYCECGNSKDIVLGKHGDRSRVVDAPSLDNVALMHHKWRDLVEEYSVMDLTKASDKLPAIAGLASDMKLRRVDSQYLWGLWSDSLHEDLLWYFNSSPSDPASVGYWNKNWRAPSWSWASIDGYINWPHSEYRYNRRHSFQRTIEFEASLLPSVDPTSVDAAVGPGTPTLQLTGATFKGRLILGEDLDYYSELFDSRQQMLFRTYEGDVGDLYLDDNEGLLEGCETLELDVVCMKMGTFITNEDGGRESEELTLVLMLEGTQKDTFRRIGMGIYTRYNFDDDDLPSEDAFKPPYDVAAELRTINVV